MLIDAFGGDKTMKLFHGSSVIVEEPLYGIGKSDNDYGSGFYTTAIEERAIEWALNNGSSKAFVNKYELDLSKLNLLDLDDYGPLAWIAEILFNRNIQGIKIPEFVSQFIEMYRVNTIDADVIRGYRADDSYTEVVKAFVDAEITCAEVQKLFFKGDLGVQYFIKSKKAFDSLIFNGADDVSMLNVNDKTQQARREAIQFMQQRRADLIRGLHLPFMTILDALDCKYIYHKQYGYYEKE